MAGIVNKAEAVTHKDLNHDGRVGGGHAHHGHAGHHSGGGGGAHHANPVTKAVHTAEHAVHKTTAKVHKH
ncbi:hypothetical protein DIPPA_26986 [Diplonema papillatum]|nr:hypothetical protein DIPPA_26975 [Diplonema papillatum]KAJ9464710.1 hypothetical protein DIPPA_26986 [Diplonema papillatum]